jgi:hypothetical protein
MTLREIVQGNAPLRLPNEASSSTEQEMNTPVTSILTRSAEEVSHWRLGGETENRLQDWLLGA